MILPLLPVTAKATVPAAAVAAAVTVKVLLELPDATLAGVKVAFTPCGAPLTDNATADLNPFNLATVSVTDADVPVFTETPTGFGVNVKVGAATVSASSTVRLNPPPVALTAIGKVPAATLEPAATFIVTGAAVVRVREEKVTVMPARDPAADSVTGELNPPCALIVRVAVFELPGETVALEESVANVKFEARLLFQLLTSRNASTEPSPVTIS